VVSNLRTLELKEKSAEDPLLVLAPGIHRQSTAHTDEGFRFVDVAMEAEEGLDISQSLQDSGAAHRHHLWPAPRA